jgi:hypothetical protein
MSPEDVPADALTDLKADKNELSVWSVDPDGANLDIVLTAVASNRQSLSKVDYALLDESDLRSIAISCIRSEGGTPYTQANAVHCDLIELTVSKVARLAHAIMPLKRVRVPEKRIKVLLQDALADGMLDRGRMNSKFLSELEPSAPRGQPIQG